MIVMSTGYANEVSEMEGRPDPDGHLSIAAIQYRGMVRFCARHELDVDDFETEVLEGKRNDIWGCQRRALIRYKKQWGLPLWTGSYWKLVS